MLAPKIELNERIRYTIQETRQNKDITSADLSKKIDKTVSYVSAIENGRVAKIASADLIQIFVILFEITVEEAVEKIQALMPKLPDKNKKKDGESIIVSYDDLDKYFSREEFEKKLKIINNIFKNYYQHDSKGAFITLINILNSFEGDIGFIMSLFKIPLNGLDKMSFEEKSELLKKTRDFFKKQLSNFDDEDDGDIDNFNNDSEAD